MIQFHKCWLDNYNRKTALADLYSSTMPDHPKACNRDCENKSLLLFMHASAVEMKQSTA